MTMPLRVKLHGWLSTVGALLALASACATSVAATPTQPARWGAIASVQQWYGYAHDHPSREAAERAARAQCERVAGRAGPCTVRAAFDRSCGALAQGNYGEWGVASAPTREQAGREATQQCNQHLPTEPCKVVVQVCSAAN